MFRGIAHYGTVRWVMWKGGLSPPYPIGVSVKGLANFFTDGDAMETGIGVDEFARDRAREIGEQEGSQIADFIGCHGTAQRCGLFHVVEDLTEILDAGSCQRFDRAGRDGVATVTLRTDGRGDVAGGCFQSSLNDTHRVVVRNDAFATQVRERHKRALTAFHQRQSGASHSREGVSGDVHGRLECVTRAAFQEVSQEVSQEA